jgi:hypothetical protein
MSPQEGEPFVQRNGGCEKLRLGELVLIFATITANANQIGRYRPTTTYPSFCFPGDYFLPPAK